MVRGAPGPGAYNPVDPMHAHGARVGFGRSVRGGETGTAQETPPPGTYNVKSSIGSGRGYTQRGKPKPMSELGAESPGPGAYNPSMKPWMHGSRISFGNAGRNMVDKKSLTPGPGAYKVRQEPGQGGAYSLVSRPLGWDAPQGSVARLPGPGQYNAHITSFGY